MRMVSPPPSLHGEETGPRKVCYKDKDTISTFIKPKSSRVAFIYMWCGSWGKKNLCIMFTFFMTGGYSEPMQMLSDIIAQLDALIR